MGVEWGTPDALKMATNVASIASLIGSVGVIGLFIFLEWWKSSTHHFILLFLSISDIMASVLVVVGVRMYGNRIFCQFQGFALQVCCQAIQSWCCIASINLLLQIKFYWRDQQCRRLLKYWHIFV